MRQIYLILILFFCSIFFFSCKSENQSKKWISNVQKQKYNVHDIDIESFNFYGYYDTSFLSTFEYEIERFRKLDKLEKPNRNQILFVGSSSIRKWKTLKDDMAPLKVINRGFGGSIIPEVIHYSNDIVFPYNPSAVVLYAGENDLTAKTNTSKWTYKMFRYFINIVKNRLPETKIYYVSIKPSPARFHLWKKMLLTNAYIKEYCEMDSSVTYIDVASEMLNENNLPKEDIFARDNLHLNEKGYQIWTSIIKKKLIGN